MLGELRLMLFHVDVISQKKRSEFCVCVFFFAGGGLVSIVHNMSSLWK